MEIPQLKKKNAKKWIRWTRTQKESSSEKKGGMSKKKVATEKKRTKK